MKHFFYRLVLVSASTLSVAIIGCSKEKLDESSPSPATPYLRFADANALKSAIGEIAKSPRGNKASVIADVIRSHSGGNEFRSLLAHPEKNDVPVLSAKGLAARKAKKQKLATKASMAREELAADAVITDQLVPDPNFAAVLNDDLELQVGSDLIKVTPQGTYITRAANKAALEKMASDNSIDSLDYTPGTLVGDGMYAMGNGITRYDTYKEDPNPSIIQPIYTDDGGVGGGGGGGTPPASMPCEIKQPQTQAFQGALPAGGYCAFPSYLYGAKTVVGGALQNLFGVNSSRENNFDSDHRIKVKLYNFDYIVYSSIGLKAKFQERGLFGIWGKADCPQIVLGWDAVVFEDKLAYSATAPILPAYNSTGVQSYFVKANERYQFVNFGVPAEMVSELSSVLVGRFGLTQAASDIENKLYDVSATKLADLTASLWSYVNTTYAPGQVALNNSITKGFRQIFPDKETIALSRFEQAYVNTGEVDLVFNWNTCQLTYSGYIDGSFSFGANIVGPTYSNKAQAYDVKKASVYGAAQYQGAWKGVRIIQE